MGFLDCKNTILTHVELLSSVRSIAAKRVTSQCISLENTCSSPGVREKLKVEVFYSSELLWLQVYMKNPDLFMLGGFFSLFASTLQAFQITRGGKTLCCFTRGQGTELISFDFLTSCIFQLCRFQTGLNSRLRNRTIFEFHPSLISAAKHDSEAFHLSFHFEHSFFVRKSEMSPSQHWGKKIVRNQYRYWILSSACCSTNPDIAHMLKGFNLPSSLMNKLVSDF